MPDNPTPRDTTPTLAELEGTYWRSVGSCLSLRRRVNGGVVEAFNLKTPGFGWFASRGKAKEFSGPAEWQRMTPAEIAATWPELAPAEPAAYPWAEGVSIEGGLIEITRDQDGWDTSRSPSRVGEVGRVYNWDAPVACAEGFTGKFDGGAFTLDRIKPALPPGGWQAGMRARVVSQRAYLADGMDGPPRIGAEGKIDLTADCGGYLTIADERTGMEWGVHPADLLYLPAAPVVATPPDTAPAKQKRGKWRKRAKAAERAAQTWQERLQEQTRAAEKCIEQARAEADTLRGERDAARAELAQAETMRASWKRTAEKIDAEREALRRQLADAERERDTLAGHWPDDPPPAAPATDPAGYREGQVLWCSPREQLVHFVALSCKGKKAHCTWADDIGGFSADLPLIHLSPIPPHPGCVVLAGGELQRVLTATPDTFSYIKADRVTRVASVSEAVVMAPAPGWQQEGK